MVGKLSWHATGCGIVEALQRRRPAVDASSSLTTGATRRYQLAPIFQKSDNRGLPIATMPVISSFYGIQIRMYFFDADQNHLPHVHAVYQGAQAQFDIDNGEVLAGKLPRAQTRLVQAWLEIRRDELTTAWSLAVTGQRPEPVLPLR